MHRLINEKCKTIRALGRQSLAGHWGEAILFILLCRVILQGPNFIYGILPEKLQASILANIINTYDFVIAGPVRLSMAYYFLQIFRQTRENGLINIKFGFNDFSRALILYIRIMVFTWLWSLLLVIPGILAAISYSQSFFILADDPNKSASQCMAESKLMMMGNKGPYFKLMLCFGLMFLITSIPSAICHNILDAEAIALAQKFLAEGDTYSALYHASDISPLVNIAMLLNTFPSVYLYASESAFYDLLCGKLIVRSADEFTETQTGAPAADFTEAEVVGTVYTPADEAPVIDVEYKEVSDDDKDNE